MSKQIHSVLVPANYFINLDDSVKYDYRLIMESKGDDPSPIETFVEKNYYSLNIPNAHYYTDLKKKALNNILANVLIANGNGQVVAISRTSGNYHIPKQYGMEHFTYTFIIGAVDALRKEKYLEQWNGFYDKEKKKGMVSRIWATSKLINELDNYVTISDEIEEHYESETFSQPINCVMAALSGRKRLNYNTPILLKDNKKKLINYKPTKRVMQFCKFLSEYNSFICNNSITINAQFLQNGFFQANSPYLSLSSSLSDIISPEECSLSLPIPLLVGSEPKSLYFLQLQSQLYRVFNNGIFTNGGRFYGAEYQALSGVQRKEILINDEPTIEVDFKALHPRMLYHLEKIDYPADPYLVVNNAASIRKPIKVMMQMMINAQNRPKAVGAFTDYLNEEPAIKEMLYSDGLDGWEIAKMIDNAHSRIRKYFSSGIGVSLQFTDSMIAERILKHFTEQGIVCLCIHDSFIVQEKYKDELIEAMKREYKRLMGFECQVKIVD